MRLRKALGEGGREREETQLELIQEGITLIEQRLAATSDCGKEEEGEDAASRDGKGERCLLNTPLPAVGYLHLCQQNVCKLSSQIAQDTWGDFALFTVPFCSSRLLC